MAEHLNEIDWTTVRRVLFIRLRSIGDTVLATPVLAALRRIFPHIKADILLEDHIAPLLEGSGLVDDILTVGKGLSSRLAAAFEIKRRRYDVVFNLHGGTTATFFAAASLARHRVAFGEVQYAFLYDRLLSSSADLWGRSPTHSAEQQMALAGFLGVPVDSAIRSELPVTAAAKTFIDAELSDAAGPIALIHPAAAFPEKQLAVEKFAEIAEFLVAKGYLPVAVAASSETELVKRLAELASVPVRTFVGLTLPQVTALASRAAVFVGNDSGIAHIAAAVGTRCVVVFGASNPDHWHPWTDEPYRVVYSRKDCGHFRGRPNAGTENPLCIKCVEASDVIAAVESLLIEELGR